MWTWQRIAVGVAAGVAAFGLSGTPAGALLGEVELEARSAPQALIDLIDDAVETNIGAPISTVDNGHPTAWVGEDVDVVLAPAEMARYRLSAYDLSYDAVDCAEYSIEVTLDVRADGPDIGAGDNLFLGVLDADENPVDGSSYASPGVVGGTIQMSVGGDVPAEVLREGVTLGYGATTAQRATPKISSGYTISPPTVDLVEDLAGCDLDADGVADDVDAFPLDPCRPDGETDACLAALAATSTTTTTVPPTAPPSADAVPSPVASAPSSTPRPAELAATGPSQVLVLSGVGLVALGVLLVSGSSRVRRTSRR